MTIKSRSWRLVPACAVLQPAKVRFKCPSCGLMRHDLDAVHCKACGELLNIPNDDAG